MIYLSEFYFPSQNSEANYLAESPRAKMTCYDSFYPFGLFAGRGLKALDLADVTILYGGNGSGKTTALNVMADALRLQRGAAVAQRHAAVTVIRQHAHAAVRLRAGGAGGQQGQRYERASQHAGGSGVRCRHRRRGDPDQNGAEPDQVLRQR